jgi:hypothetical protein
MNFFECGYAGKDKDRIRMRADLNGGWRQLDKGWGFDAEVYLDYRNESKFRCRLYLLAKAPSSFETRKTFPERYIPDPVEFGNNFISLHGTKLEVDVPMDQVWKQTSDNHRRPCIYEFKEDIFSIATDDGTIYYRIQIWVVFHGESRMFVPDQHEWGDGFAWIGGLPESNRR